MNTSIPSSAERAPLGRTLGAALVAVLIAAIVVAVPRLADAASDFDNVDQRLVDSFVDAGVSISEGAYAPESVNAVVLVTTANFPDALTASAVAAAVGGPVLFTDPTALPPATAAEIDRLLDAGDTVHVMGGVQAISDAVESELVAAGYTVNRIEGETRLETAAAAMTQVGVTDGRVIIARAFGPDGAGTPSDRTTGWVDAVSCGAWAAANRVPILLTETRTLSDTTTSALQDADVTEAIICGGPAAISQQVEADLQALGITSRRIAGLTRVETAVDAAINLFGFATAGGRQFTVVNGYGENFGYGLAAAPLGNPILLVGTTEPTSCEDAAQPSRQTLCYLQTGTDEAPASLLVVGSEALIRDAVSNAAGEAAGGAPVPTETPTPDPSTRPPLPAPTNVDARDDINDDGTRATVTWNAVADPDRILRGYNVYVGDRRQGTATPTVAAGTTTFTLTGLTKDQQARVSVTTLDAAGRESARSTAALVTPRDEVPTAITGFTAVAGNAQVVLRWDAGPVDTASYLVERGTPGMGGTCPGSGYTTVATVTSRDTTTTTDTGVTNNTAYCYRISVTDTAGQTSPVTNTGPVTPNTGAPAVILQYPVSRTQPQPRDTIHYGAPVVVRYTVNDSDTPAADLRVTVELSYDADRAYRPVATNVPVRFTTEGQQGPATFPIPSCALGDTTSETCIRDVEDDNVRVRVTVTDPQQRGGSVSSGDVNLSRTPPPVENLSSTGAGNAVTVAWDRIDAPATIVPRYRVSRAAVPVPQGSTAGSEACPSSSQAYTNVGTVPQPAAAPSGVTRVSFSDGNVDAEGTQLNDVLYCYLVQAERDLEPTVTGPSRLTAVNPAPGVAGSVTIQAPSNGATLTVGAGAQIRYELTVPQGQTVTDVRIFWCRDFRAATTLSPATCADVGGFKEMTPGEGGLNAEPPRTTGTHTVTWTVPAAARQGDNQQGAIEIRLEGVAGSARVTGLLFR